MKDGCHTGCTSNVFFFSSRRRHTRLQGDWSSDVCSSDLRPAEPVVRLRDGGRGGGRGVRARGRAPERLRVPVVVRDLPQAGVHPIRPPEAGHPAVPDLARGLHVRVSERQVDANLRLEGEGRAVRAGGPAGAPQHVSRTAGPGENVAPHSTRLNKKATSVTLKSPQMGNAGPPTGSGPPPETPPLHVIPPIAGRR